MDSLGDYIYLIVILIAAISSILSKKKKKQAIEVETTNFPDLEDVIPGFTENVQPESPVNNERRVKEAEHIIPTYDTVQDISVMKAKKQVKSVKQHKEPEPEAEETSFLSEIELDTVDEVKKAFIYAEIINRRYS
ncbi:MAG: hypothetical protein PHQ11_06685 [Paludibacter sp.]|nr:hypothetical protein [Paludibacter sp.]MDD4427047.1 hypothetical protein [Paludibacter sp.]